MNVTAVAHAWAVAWRRELQDLMRGGALESIVLDTFCLLASRTTLPSFLKKTYHP